MVDPLNMATAFERGLCTSRINENPSHRPGRHGEEVRPVLPVHLPGVDEPEKRLVHQCRGLQRMPGVFLAHVVPGQATELLVDERRQAIERGGIALSPCLEKSGDFCAVPWHFLGFSRRL